MGYLEIIHGLNKRGATMFLYIYKITNLLNGKIYVGKHSCSKIENSYLGSGVAIRRAIKKYGRDNFQKEVLCLCENEDELNDKEVFWIEKTGSFGNGYNMTKGGEGALGRVMPKEEKERARLSRIKYYENNPEARSRLSRLAKERSIGNKNPFYGKTLSKEHIEKMTKARIKAISGSKNKSAVRVKCVETGEVFYTAKQAASSCSLKHSTTILKAAKGQRKMAGGYRWKLI